MFDAYEVAVRLKLVDHFSSVMSMVVNRLVEGHTHADRLQKKLEGIGRLFKAGVLTTGAGVGIAMALKASTNEAVRYEQQLNRLKALNLDIRFGAGATASLEQGARSIGDRTKGTSRIDAMRLMTETQSITGNIKHTLELAPILAQMRFGLETYMAAGGKGDGHGEKAEGQFRDIIKVMEMRGLMRNFDEKSADRLSDLFVKNYVASGGQVKPSDFLAMMKTGGVAAKSVSEDFLYAMGHIIQEKGGSRAGTAVMSGYQNMVAGRTTQQVAEQLLKYGLLKPGSIEYGTTGHIKKVKPDALKAAELYASSPLAFLLEELQPALAKKGVDVEDAKKVIPIINQLYSNRMAADQMTSLYLEREQIQNYMAQAKNAMGVKQLYQTTGASATGEQNDLMAKVSNLELEFGTAALPLMKNALEQAIPLVKQFGEWLGKHPDGLSMLVKGIAGLAVAMTVSGPLMVLGSGIGLLSTAAISVSGPIGSLAVAMGMRSIGGAMGLATLAGNLRTVSGQLKLLGAVVLAPLRGIGLALGLLRGGSVVGVFRSLGSRITSFAGVIGRGFGFLARGALLLGRALLMNPIGLVVTAIAGAAYLLYRNWRTVGPVVMKTWEIIKAVFSVSMEWISQRMAAAWAVMQPYWEKGRAIIEATSRFVGDKFSSIYGAISGWIGKIVDWVANSPIGKAIGWVANKAGAANSLATNAVSAGFDSAYAWALAENSRAAGPSLLTGPLAPVSPVVAQAVKAPVAPVVASPIPASREAPVPGAAPYNHGGSPYIAPRAPQSSTTINNKIVMPDGRVLAEVVTQQMSKDAAKPYNSASGFDWGMGLAPVGMGYGR